MILRILRDRIPNVRESLDPPHGVMSYLDLEHEDAGFSRKNSLEFLKIVLVHKWACFLALVFLTVSVLTSVYSPRILGYMIDDGLVPRNVDVFVGLLFLYVGNESIRLISSALQNYLFTLVGQGVMQDIRIRMLERFLQVPFSTLDKIPSGNLVSRLTDDVKYLADMLQSGLIHVVQDFITVIAIVIAMFCINWKLASIALIGLPITCYCGAVLTRQLLGCHRVIRKFSTGYVAFLTDCIEGASVVRLFNKQLDFVRRSEWIVSAHMQARLDRIRINSFFHPLVTLLNGLGTFLLFVGGFFLIRSGEVGVGLVVAFVTYLGWILWPIVKTVNNFDVFLAGVASLERIFSALSWPVEEDGGDCVSPNVPFQGRIELQDVWFAYEPDQWVLKGVNLVIQPGQLVGIVGPTGSGKSTLIGLLLRFYRPQKGRIMCDGIDIENIPIKVLRSRIGLVQQESGIFEGSVEENITLWDSSRPTVLQDICARKIFSSLMPLERTLTGKVEELSAGTAQLLAFARCYYRSPDIWILDEATAHVDPYLDLDLNSMLDEVAGSRTRLVIAHRLSSVVHATKIVVLCRGELVESGSHAQLCEKNGLYAAMLRAQESLVADF
jgi:ATP-binding cassette subfamily B multidrug efflux pump